MPYGKPGTSSGDVVGPASSTAKAASRFADTTGLLLEDSSFIIGDVAGANVTVHAGAGNSLTLATLDSNKNVIVAPHGTGHLTIPDAGLFFNTLGNRIEYDNPGYARLRYTSGFAHEFLGTRLTPETDVTAPTLGSSSRRWIQLFLGPTGIKIGDGTNGPTITATGSSPNEAMVLTALGTGGVAVDGTATNDAAAAGFVGELLSAQLAAASTTSLVTATGKTITSLSLTAGDWEVSGSVHFIPANTTVVASLIASVSAVDNTQASVDSVGGFASIGAVYTSGGATMSATPIPIRISLAATTTYYLVATATFSISTCTGYGTLRARRLR